ncbi:hypothetical protein ABE288_02615 [Bacillus salipaludis]|uniref:hypothetical protein n=1 Tax=Bacillus salipaludis TaxID=2547811 RepID=UPI003D23E758
MWISFIAQTFHEFIITLAGGYSVIEAGVMSIAAVINIIYRCTRTAATRTTPSIFRENTDWKQTFSFLSSLHHHHHPKL